MCAILHFNRLPDMKKKLYLLLLLPLSFLVFLSCEKEEVDVDSIKTFVEYSLVCDNPDALIEIKSTGLGSQGTKFHGGIFTKKFYTRDYFVIIDATCEDENATMTLALSVNGKEVLKKEGKAHMVVGQRVKGSENGE